jgi:hypothetical protein
MVLGLLAVVLTLYCQLTCALIAGYVDDTDNLLGA